MHKEPFHRQWRRIGLAIVVLLLVCLPVSLWMAGAPPTSERSHDPVMPIAPVQKPSASSIGPSFVSMPEPLASDDTVPLPQPHRSPPSPRPEAPPAATSAAELPFRVIHSRQIFSTNRPSKQEQERLKLALESYAQERSGTLFFDADGLLLTTVPAVIYYRPELDITQTIKLIYDQMATMEEDHLATAAE